MSARHFATTGTLILVGAIFGAAALGLELKRRSLSAELIRQTPAKSATIAPIAASIIPSVVATPNDRALDFDLAAALAAARRDVAALEHRAQRRHDEIAAESARRMATAFIIDPKNPDPERGFVMLESFQNVGRETPAAAFQTLIWAALKGDESMLADGLTLEDRAHARAEALVAGLPESTRRQFTPGKLAALWFEGSVVDVPAAQILRQTQLDATHVMLLTRGSVGGGPTVTLRKADSGWQLIVPEHGLETVQKKVIGSSPPLK